jgi:NAD(P)-dependent dehydrogenase (short-subunit alcohol dehydrogenase family)
MAEKRALKILITGGAQGIGRGLFRHFLSSGHHVVILDNNQEQLEHVKTLAPKWAGDKPTWHALQCDLSKRNELKTTMEQVSQLFTNSLDVLINNAFPTTLSLSDDKRIESPGTSIEDEWDLKLAIGLTAPFLLTRLCVPLLVAGSSTPGSPGTVINMSSTRAYQAEDDHEAYSATKAGLIGLTQSSAVSLGHRHKIRVNALIPGWVHVMNECKAADEKGMSWDDELSKEDQEWHPAGRVGMVEDVARAVEYLVESGFVTGQEVVVDGGVGRKMVYPE